MEQSRQPELGLQTGEEQEKLPFSLKAKIISIQKGIPYREAFGLMLEEEVKDKAKERQEGHAP
ncbi:MAG: hypothetical protein AAB548_00425 [Patescibacteria group bacterium]